MRSVRFFKQREKKGFIFFKEDVTFQMKRRSKEEEKMRELDLE